MPEIKEFDVVIKTISYDELKQLFGEGVKDVRVRVTWGDDRGERTLMNTNMKLIVETWQPKPPKAK